MDWGFKKRDNTHIFVSAVFSMIGLCQALKSRCSRRADDEGNGERDETLGVLLGFGLGFGLWIGVHMAIDKMDLHMAVVLLLHFGPALFGLLMGLWVEKIVCSRSKSAASSAAASAEVLYV